VIKPANPQLLTIPLATAEGNDELDEENRGRCWLFSSACSQVRMIFRGWKPLDRPQVLRAASESEFSISGAALPPMLWA